MRCFQNCLDYFHLENLEQLINRSLPHEKIKKRSKIDPDRAAYSTLLDHTVNELERFRREAENGQTIRSPALMDMQLISPISNELIELTKRECNERAILFQIIFTFYKQALIIMDISCQETIKKALLEYFQNLQTHRKQSENQINVLKNQLMQIRSQNDEKWKTFYMIVKDNRVLRRQKGKLMRTLQQQKQKICNVHEEMMQLAKQNEKNKLLANYANNPESMALFLKNTQAVMKLDQFMKNYPKQTKKMLNIDLKKLEVSENISLDQKIMYIIKTAKESQQIFDEYQDLMDMNQRPNKLIFNISTQTDPFDIGIDPALFKVEQLKPLKKLGRNVQCQTHRQMKMDLHIINIVQVIKAMPQSKIGRRRKALQTNAVQDLCIVDAIKYFKENGLCRKVCNIKILCKSPNKKAQQHQSNIYNLTVHHENELNDFPTLKTDHKLQFDIKRSKDFIRKQQQRRSNRNINSNRSSIDLKLSKNKQEQEKFDISKIKIKDFFQQLIQETCPQQKNAQTQQVKKIIQKTSQVKPVINNSEKKSEQRYIINPPQRLKSGKKSTELVKSFESRKQTTNISTNQSTKNQNNTISYENNKAPANKQKKSLKQIINRTYKKPNNQNQQTDYTPISIVSQIKSERNRFQISTEGSKKEMRKSGFAAYKRLNTVPDDVVVQQSSNESAKKSPQEKITFTLEQKCDENKQQVQKIQPQPIIRQTTNLKLTFPYSRKSSSRVKVVNIYAYENAKLIDKLYKHIFMKRKQIAESVINFDTFLNSYIKTQYGSNQKIVINTHFTPLKMQRNNHHLYAIFDTLLDKSPSNEYLQHLFKLFAKLLIINGVQNLSLPFEKGKLIEDQIFSLHFGQAKRQQIFEKNNIFDQPLTINLCQSFLNLDYYLRKSLQSSQITKFFKKLLPISQQFLTYDQLKEIFSLFAFEDKHNMHLITLKQYCVPQISIQNICFYAIRQEWKPLLDIQDYITDTYERMCIIKEDLDQPTCISFSQKFRWTQQLVKEKQKNWNNETFILRKYRNILQVNHLLEISTPTIKYLNQIQNQFCILSLKQQLRSIIF